MIYLYLFGTCFHFIYVFMIIGKNLSVDPTSYLNIYGEGTLINSYWGLYED